MLLKTAAFLGLAGLLCSLAIGVGGASAQATRTWVSGVGDDVNPCSRTAPCKTFAGTIAKTAAGGEINCIDPGGFGAVTITKSMTINCSNVLAGILSAGGNGINVSAGAGDVVNLIGLEFEGLAGSGNGIAVNTAAKVNVINCIIFGFGQSGILIQPTLNNNVNLIGDVIDNNSSTGVLIRPGAGSAKVTVMLDQTRLVDNTGGGILANGTVSGFAGTIGVAIRNSEASNNSGNGFGVFSGGVAVQMLVDESTATGNGNTGIVANGMGATVRFTRSTISNNTTGVLFVSSGVAASYGTNSIDGNGSPGSFTMVAQQ
jgi:hypothetical protein